MAVHVPGKKNVLADALSRLQMSPQMLRERGMNVHQEAVPQHLLPGNWIGQKGWLLKHALTESTLESYTRIWHAYQLFASVQLH